MQSIGMPYGSLESSMQNIKVLTQQKPLLAFKALFETDMECMETLWLIEVMYAIKRDLLGFNGSWEDYMQEIKGLSQEIRKT